MGLLISRFYSKPSTRDCLEKIELELQTIEGRRWDRMRGEQLTVQILTYIPNTILIANICLVLYPSDAALRDKLVTSIPIVLLNVALYTFRQMIQWYSRWSLNNAEARIRQLKIEKKRLLDQVCETESYKVAKEILEKYDPKQLRQSEQSNNNENNFNSSFNRSLVSPVRSPPSSSQKQTKQQQQHNKLLYQSLVHNQSITSLNQSMTAMASQVAPPLALPIAPTPMSKRPVSLLNNTMNNSLAASAVKGKVITSSVQGRPVRPILSRDRGLLDRVVDLVIGDGPENRFALICKSCHGHNGMCLAEEYHDISFRCCYCYNLNEAPSSRQQVEDGPKSPKPKDLSPDEKTSSIESTTPVKSIKMKKSKVPIDTTEPSEPTVGSSESLTKTPKPTHQSLEPTKPSEAQKTSEPSESTAKQ